MKEEHMHRFINALYDGLAGMPEVRTYYNGSDYLNFGYWDVDTADQKQACENLMEQMLAMIPQKQGKILDIACGKGATTAYLAKYYLPENVTGLNISEKQLDIARTNAPGCSFQLMNATDMKFPDNSFDAVISVEAAFHFLTREKFLEESLRVLKPGGRLVVSDILMTLEGEKRRESRTGKNFLAGLDDYRALLKRVGFIETDIVNVTEQCWERYFWYVIHYFHKKFLSGEIESERLQQYLSQTYRRAGDIEYYLLAAGTKGMNKEESS